MKDMKMSIVLTIQTDDDITKDEILNTLKHIMTRGVEIEYKDFVITDRYYTIKEI
tara:strand:+ start:2936 stop:3100 length:165 start_codon:yes stop_codon:yes gene_type:complete